MKLTYMAGMRSVHAKYHADDLETHTRLRWKISSHRICLPTIQSNRRHLNEKFHSRIENLNHTSEVE